MEDINQEELAQMFLLNRRDDSQALLHQRRWYDHNHMISTIIHVLDGINVKKRIEIIYHLIDYVQKYRKVLIKLDDITPHVPSTDKILGLYQSSKNQRWYDQIPGLPKLIDSMSILPDEHYNIILEECIRSADTYYRLYENGSQTLRNKINQIIENRTNLYTKKKYEDVKYVLNEGVPIFTNRTYNQPRSYMALKKKRGFHINKEELNTVSKIKEKQTKSR